MKGWTPKLPTIQEALEFRREMFGWTATRMAAELGLQKSHYSEIIRRKRKLPYRAACMAFEIGIPYTVLLQTKKTKRAYEIKHKLTKP